MFRLYQTEISRATREFLFAVREGKIVEAQMLYSVMGNLLRGLGDARPPVNPAATT